MSPLDDSLTIRTIAQPVCGVKLKYEHGALEFAPGNAFELTFSTPFDAVLATEVIEHVAHPDAFLQHIAKLVPEQGVVVLTTPNGAYLRNSLPKFSDVDDPSIFETEQFKPDADGHIFLLWPHEIQRLANEAGFEVERIELFSTPLTAGHMKLGWLLRWLPRWLILTLERAARQLPWGLKQRVMVQSAVRLRRRAVAD